MDLEFPACCMQAARMILRNKYILGIANPVVQDGAHLSCTMDLAIPRMNGYPTAWSIPGGILHRYNTYYRSYEKLCMG